MKLRKIILEILSNILWRRYQAIGEDVLRSVISHLRSVRSHLRKVRSHLEKVRSHLRKVISQKVFLCRYKPTARDFGKRFDGVIYNLKKTYQSVW